MFFALWPTPEVANSLHAWAVDAQARTGGRVTRAPTIHLTLAFIGPVADERLEPLVDCGNQVSASAFDLHIEDARWWKHNAIVWAGPRETPLPLRDLAAQLEGRLRAAGFPTEKREYKAHITLVRKAELAKGDSLPPLAPSGWRAGEFVLVRSTLSAGPAYEVVARYSLA